MALYSRAMDLGLAMPTRPDTLTPGAIEAVEAMRAAGRELIAERAISSLVTVHGHRRIVPHSGKPPAALVRVRNLAESKGWTVKAYESPTGHALQGRRGDLGFRAMWQWGKTAGCTWHEREPRWTLIDDPRPVKMNTRDHVGLKGYRSEGMGRVRLHLLAAPWGLPINVTTLEERLAAS